MTMTRLFLAGIVCLVAARVALAQGDVPSKVPIAFNRYYTYAELEGHMKAIAAAYPEVCELRRVGTSGQGRDMWIAIVNNPATGAHSTKPAMYIEGNVHGNEIQAAEVVLYSLWYLTKGAGKVEGVDKLLKDYAFYLCVSVNPDGREYWFNEVNNSSSSRSNQAPVDSDRDGLIDEDPPEDLDGDGSITQMWKAEAGGAWIRDRFDPRVFTRVPPDEKGDWSLVGSEGIDNDDDGQINEDGPGGYDMNRSYPGGWLPEYVQFGAGPYPFAHPETFGTGMFILNHPNIGGVQSYHNSGGMVLRGPGAAFRENLFPGQDVAVYDEIQRAGEQLLPYYRMMVIHRDLYTVHGGMVNWTGETLGVFSFTNEMMNPGMIFQRTHTDPDEAMMKLFRERLMFGQTFKDYTAYDHPRWGKVLIGGQNKWSSRNTPTFMLEEECHRNFAFTMFHADQMPVLSFDRVDVAKTGEGAWTVTASVRNAKAMPTRSALARQKGIGRNDLLTCAPAEGSGASVSASGRVGSFLDRQAGDFVRFEPGRVQVDGGVPGRGSVIHRYFVSGQEGDRLTLRYEAQKARTIETTVELR
ncbi:MAG: M14 family metallopeptidase [Phycisphaerales bacterium]